jgi:serine/threonine protein kinase
MAGTLIGSYRLLEEISTGGMGTVYKAKHELIGRPAAVKLLRPDLDTRQEIIDRFFNEARAATAIRHPGIVEIFDFGYTEDGHGYLVMELLVGKTLKRAIADVGRYTEPEAAAIARGIASALKAAHAQGIYHRDLKPDNVFLVPDLEGTTGSVRPKVLDFGIAKLTEDGAGHTKMGMLIGTPSYMAPEQAREASAVDHRADLYSLGCILYEMLTGRPPFVSEGAGEIVAMHLMDEPMPPRSLESHITPAMDAIVLRLLEKDPAKRFQSAGELMQALTPLMNGARDLVLMSGPRTAVHPRNEPSTLREFVAPVASTQLSRPRSRIPLIAGVVTVLVAIGVIAILAMRGDDKPAKVEVIKATPAPTPAPAVKRDEPKPRPPETAPSPPPITETKQVPGKPPIVVKPPVPAPKKPPPGPTTIGGSPVEIDLGDDGKKKVPRP